VVSREEKFVLMKRSHIVLVTSVKEGWGLVVTEANSMGTPAIVYNVDGLRDSVKNGVTGLVTSQNKPEDLAKALSTLLGDENKYQKIRQAALESARTMTYDKCYTDFLTAIKP
jgi:glycosyltransferase involved in cell wall biosynthesis